MKNIILLLILILVSSCSSTKITEKNIKTGYFSYFADAPLFVDCETNEKYPVAMEGDYIFLEEEYLKINESAGQSILISLHGKFEERSGMEGDGKRKFLIVNKLLNIFPNETCE
jgi:uncharacterized lipoprotein NlpE involved in copper resistance